MQSKKRQMKLNSDRYFNSGVMWIDTRQWVAQQITEQVIEFLLHTRTTTFDQDALNMVLSGKVRYIDKQWNYLKDRIICDDSISADCIFLHYIGGENPGIFPIPIVGELIIIIMPSCQNGKIASWSTRILT